MAEKAKTKKTETEEKKTTKKSTKTTEKPVLETGKVINCGALRIRSEADLMSDTLTTVPSGEEVTIIDKEVSKDFYKVKVGKIEGFCIKLYIELK